MVLKAFFKISDLFAVAYRIYIIHIICTVLFEPKSEMCCKQFFNKDQIRINFKNYRSNYKRLINSENENLKSTIRDYFIIYISK